METQEFHRDRYYAARLRPGVVDPFDVRVFDYRVHRALRRNEAQELTTSVLAAFDSLRTGIVREESRALKAQITSDAAGLVDYVESESLGFLSGTREECRRANLRTIDLLQGCLAKFCYYVSPGEGATVLRIVCSHFAMDQATHGQLSRFIATSVAGVRQVSSLGPTYLDWMESYYRHAISTAGGVEAGFWRNYFPRDFENARRTFASNCHDGGLRATYRLPSAAVTVLREIGSRLRCRVSDLITAQTLLVLGNEYDLDRVPVCWTAHGRYPLGGHNFSRTSGWLGERHPLLVPLQGGTVEIVCQNFRDAITGLPLWGNAYGWVNRFADGAEPCEPQVSPFIFNVQEGHGPGRNHFDAGGLSFEPFSRPGVPPRIYVVISVGTSPRITMEYAGGPDPEACRRIARAIEASCEALCETSGV